MALFDKFARDCSGSMHEKATLVAMLAIIGSLATVATLDQLTREGGLPRIAILPPARSLEAKIARLPRESESPSRVRLSQATVDYTPVGSIPANLSQPITLDPCTGAQK